MHGAHGGTGGHGTDVGEVGGFVDGDDGAIVGGGDVPPVVADRALFCLGLLVFCNCSYS